MPADKEPPRRVTGLRYRSDGVGFVLDRLLHLFVVDVTADEPHPRQLTDGDKDDLQPVWSPDGSRLAFVSARHDEREHDRCTDVVTVAPDGTDLTVLTDGTLLLGAPTWTPDGTALTVLGVDPGPTRADWVSRHQSLWRIDAATPGARPTRLTDTESVHLVDRPAVVDGDDALVLTERRGAVELLAVALDGSGTRTVCSGPRQLSGVDRAGGVTVVSCSLGDDRGRARACRRRRLADHAHRLRRPGGRGPGPDRGDRGHRGRRLRRPRLPGPTGVGRGRTPCC